MNKKTKSIQKCRIPQNNSTLSVGVHLLADFWYGKIIEETKKIEEILRQSVREANNSPLEVVVHKFHPQGLTGVILLAESHIAVHSWPEMNYLAVDIFTCGKKSNPHQALQYLKKVWQPKKVKIIEIKRGTHAAFDNYRPFAS